MRLSTDRLALRPFAAADVDALHALWTQPLVRRYLWDDVVIDRATAEDVVTASVALVAARGYGLCVVHERDGGAFVGFCGLRDFADPRAGGAARPELLYGLDPHYWSRGYAFEASVAVLRFAFDDRALEVVHAGTDPPNERSRRVLDRLGFQGWERIEVGGLPADYASVDATGFARALAAAGR